MMELPPDRPTAPAPPELPCGFVRFHRHVLAEPALFEQLQNAPTLDAFVALSVALGAVHGCPFTAGDVRNALQAARRTWIERAAT